MRRLTRYEMSSVDGEIYLDSSNTRVINAAEAKVCLAMDVDDLENDLYEQEEKTKQYKVLYKETCRDINTQERFFAEQLYHQKYKRCLLRSVIAEMNATHFKDLFYKAGSEALADEYNKQITIHYKWSKLWLDLADKFKQLTTTAQ